MEKKNRQLLIALACALAIALVAGIPTIAAGMGDARPAGTVFQAADDNVAVVVELDSADYTLSDTIVATVRITNNSTRSLVYVQGSGSNRVPDAFDIRLGRLAALFHPAVMTMDYGVHELEPGETLELNCPFVPYTAKSSERIVGTDMTIRDFVDNDDFAAASPGIVGGTFRFTYGLLPEGYTSKIPSGTPSQVQTGGSGDDAAVSIDLVPGGLTGPSLLDFPTDQVVSGEFQTLIRVPRS